MRVTRDAFKGNGGVTVFLGRVGETFSRRCLPIVKSEGEASPAGSRVGARNPSVFSTLDHTTVIKGTHLSG